MPEEANFISTRYTKIKAKIKKHETKWEQSSFTSEASLIRKLEERMKPDVVILPVGKKFIIKNEKNVKAYIIGDEEINRKYKQIRYPPPEKQKEIGSSFIAKELIKSERETLFVEVKGNVKIALISDHPQKNGGYTEAEGEKTVVSKILIDMKENSKVEVADIRLKNKGWLVSSLRFWIGRNSELNYMFIDMSEQSFSTYEEKEFLLDGKAKLTGGNIWHGEGVGVFHINSELSGEGAEVRDNHICVGRDKKHLEVDYFLDHLERKTKGYLITRGVLFDSAWVVFLEDAKIRERAFESASYVEGKAILFSDKVKSYLIPSMEIDTNEVQAKHSASMGKIGEKELFYVMSRGISEEDAKKLIVEGFLGEVVNLFPKVSWLEVEDIIPKLLHPSQATLL